MSGKGSTPRPTDQRKFTEAYTRIFGQRCDVCSRKLSEKGDCTRSDCPHNPHNNKVVTR